MSYYKLGDNFKWFIARVANVEDTEKLGRVQIRVINDQTGDFGDNNKGIPDSDLLWAWPISAIQSASLHKKKIIEYGEHVANYMGGIGLSPTGITKGTYVFGFYIDGNEQNIPVIFGTYHKTSVFPDPPKASEMTQIDSVEGEYFNDVSPLARAEWDSDFQNAGEPTGQILPKRPYKKGKLVEEPESAYGAKYPYNMVYTTKSGHAIEIDDTPGAERIHIYHKSGSYEEIDTMGRRVKRTTDHNIEINLKDNKIYTEGKTDIECKGNVKLLAHRDVDAEITGNMKIHAKGFIEIKSDKKIIMKAPRIDLNPDSVSSSTIPTNTLIPQLVNDALNQQSSDEQTVQYEIPNEVLELLPTPKDGLKENADVMKQLERYRDVPPDLLKKSVIEFMEVDSLIMDEWGRLHVKRPQIEGEAAVGGIDFRQVLQERMTNSWGYTG